MTDLNNSAALAADAVRFAQEQKFNQFQQALLTPSYGGTGVGAVNTITEIVASAAIGGVGSLAVVTS